MGQAFFTLVIQALIDNTNNMNMAQIIYIVSRLLFGAIAAFLAINLWSKTRDISWMLMVAGAIALYVETIYSVLSMFGIVEGSVISINSLSTSASVITIVLTNLPVLFFIAAFITLVKKK